MKIFRLNVLVKFRFGLGTS